LDALGWVGLARDAARDAPGAGPDGQASPGLELRAVDVTASRLRLLGADFADTRVRLQAANDAIVARLQGSGIDGEVRVPEASGATVSGRFARVHWPLPGAGTAGAGSADDDTPDPSALPPFAIDIEDLSLGDARLGSLVLRTQPVPAGL